MVNIFVKWSILLVVISGCAGGSMAPPSANKSASGKGHYRSLGQIEPKASSNRAGGQAASVQQQPAGAQAAGDAPLSAEERRLGLRREHAERWQTVQDRLESLLAEQLRAERGLSSSDASWLVRLSAYLESLETQVDKPANDPARTTQQLINAVRTLLVMSEAVQFDRPLAFLAEAQNVAILDELRSNPRLQSIEVSEKVWRTLKELGSRDSGRGSDRASDQATPADRVEAKDTDRATDRNTDVDVFAESAAAGGMRAQLAFWLKTRLQRWQQLAVAAGLATSSEISSQPTEPNDSMYSLQEGEDPLPGDLESADEILDSAKALAAQGQYAEAVMTLRRLQDANVMPTVAGEQIKTYSNRAVRELRKKAAQAYQSAAPLTDLEARKVYLQKAQEYLQSAIEDFPASDQASVVRENLKVIEAALTKVSAG